MLSKQLILGPLPLPAFIAENRPSLPIKTAEIFHQEDRPKLIGLHCWLASLPFIYQPAFIAETLFWFLFLNDARNFQDHAIRFIRNHLCFRTECVQQGTSEHESCLPTEWEKLSPMVWSQIVKTFQKGKEISVIWMEQDWILVTQSFMLGLKRIQWLCLGFGTQCNWRSVGIVCFSLLLKKSGNWFTRPIRRCKMQPLFTRSRQGYQPPSKVHSWWLNTIIWWKVIGLKWTIIKVLRWSAMMMPRHTKNLWRGTECSTSLQVSIPW